MKTILPILSSLLLFTSVASAETVDTCGQRVTQGALMADLDCADTTGFAVILNAGGSLDLAGHQIVSGRSPEALEGGAVYCEGDCSVTGGSLRSGLPYDWHKETRNLPVGVLIPHPRRGQIRVSDVDLSRYLFGVSAISMRIENVTGTEMQAVLTGKNLRVLRSSFTGNAQGLAARRVAFKRSEISDSGFGMTARHAIVRRSTISGNRQIGIMTADGAKEGTVVASDSVIDGNCLESGYGDCVDFSTSSSEPPELDNVECSRSGRYIIATDTWTNWGVCDED